MRSVESKSHVATTKLKLIENSSLKKKPFTTKVHQNLDGDGESSEERQLRVIVWKKCRYQIFSIMYNRSINFKNHTF